MFDDYDDDDDHGQAMFRFGNTMSLSGGKTKIVGIVVVALVGLATLLYMSGVINCGVESRRRTFNAPLTSSNQGFNFGANPVRLKAGQTLVVQYEAAVTRGALSVYVRKALENPGSPWVMRRTIAKNSKGRIDLPIEENGYYRLVFDGSPRGNGYDVEYTAYWWATHTKPKTAQFAPQIIGSQPIR